MSFEKTSSVEADDEVKGWCTCINCDSGDSLYSDYNKRSGPENPKQYSA